MKDQPDNMVKHWSKSELEQFEHTIHKILEENNWRDGHKFHSRGEKYLNNISTMISQDSVKLSYDIIGYVNNKRVEKHVVKRFYPGVMSAHKIYQYIDDIELLIRYNPNNLNLN